MEEFRTFIILPGLESNQSSMKRKTGIATPTSHTESTKFRFLGCNSSDRMYKGLKVASRVTRTSKMLPTRRMFIKPAYDLALKVKYLEGPPVTFQLFHVTFKVLFHALTPLSVHRSCPRFLTLKQQPYRPALSALMEIFLMEPRVCPISQTNTPTPSGRANPNPDPDPHPHPNPLTLTLTLTLTL